MPVLSMYKILLSYIVYKYRIIIIKMWTAFSNNCVHIIEYAHKW